MADSESYLHQIINLRADFVNLPDQFEEAHRSGVPEVLRPPFSLLVYFMVYGDLSWTIPQWYIRVNAIYVQLRAMVG